MKKNKLISYIIYTTMVLAMVTISGCEKKSTNNYGSFPGTWISNDLADTIEFTTDRDLYKMIMGFNDHYLYNYTNDSITIEYNGRAMPFIYMGPPTPAYYELSGNKLTIDFIRAPFGFMSQKTIFIRK